VGAGVLRIARLRKGSEQYEPDKEPGIAVAGHLADRDGLVAGGYHSSSSRRNCTGSACYRCRRSDPGGSVSGSVWVSVTGNIGVHHIHHVRPTIPWKVTL
jgi:hypothetical protein